MLGHAGPEGKSMDALTWFGLAAVSAMLLCYANEHRGRAWVLGFAGACLAGSTYGFMQGAWPFGLVEAIWSVVALRRWWGLQAPEG
jgi:hypothetical protein